MKKRHKRENKKAPKHGHKSASQWDNNGAHIPPITKVWAYHNSKTKFESKTSDPWLQSELFISTIAIFQTKGLKIHTS